MKTKRSKKKLNRRERARFKRKWGVTEKIFDKMLLIISDWKAKNKDERGRKSLLSIIQRLEITLMYYSNPEIK